MRPACALAAVLALGALCAPVRAQEVEIVPLAGLGYSTGHDFDPVAPELQQVGLTGGLTWGGQIGVFVSGNTQLELSWVQHQSALNLRSARGEAELFDMTIGQLHGGLAYHLGHSARALRPFVVASLGLAFLGAPGLGGDTKFSWALGAGVNTFGDGMVGLKLQARYKRTHLGGSASDPGCLPFGFCTASLGQAEVTAGIVLRP